MEEAWVWGGLPYVSVGAWEEKRSRVIIQKGDQRWAILPAPVAPLRYRNKPSVQTAPSLQNADLWRSQLHSALSFPLISPTSSTKAAFDWELLGLWVEKEKKREK